MTSPVGRLIVDRRLQIGYDTIADAARGAGIGTTTWGLMEAQGRFPKSRRVRQKVAATLRWPPQALDNLAAGIDPEAAVSSLTTAMPEGTLEERVEELAAEISRSHKDLSARLDRIAAHLEQALNPPQEKDGQAQ